MSVARRIIIAVFIITCVFSPALAQQNESRSPRGIWVSVFSDRQVLYSQNAVRTLIEFCRSSGIDEIYLQVYQSGIAYYDSVRLERTAYTKMLERAGGDPVDVLLKEAHAAGVRVYAWINVLSVGANTKAPVVRLLGESCLTRDQHGRISLKSGDTGLDAYYLRENQAFLDPGDYRVREYLAGIVSELCERYPDFDGLHLDYIRYPYGVPFVPGSRFNAYGLTYGYSVLNMAAFKKITGLDAMRLRSDGEFLEWDTWKRGRLTLLVENLRQVMREKRPGWRLSAAVLPVWERSYASAFQDWPGWLKRGLIDYAVLMNYTLDDVQFEYVCRSGAALKGKGKVYAGIGAFLMDKYVSQIATQAALAQEAGCDGVVFFSYNGLTPAMERALKQGAL
jgi:uncharacterized lipoprotein YddW (UPF0748 family)